MASTISCSPASAGMTFETAVAADGGQGFEIQRIGHGDGQDRVVEGGGDHFGLAHEARRESVDFGSDGRRAFEYDEGDLELLGKDGKHIAIGDRPHVDQDLAQLVAAFALEFEGAVEVVLLDEVAIEEHAPDGDAADGSVGTGGIDRYCRRRYRICSWITVARPILFWRALISFCFWALMVIW